MMRAAFYTRQGAAADVLQVGEQPVPEPGPGEVRVRLRASGVNPSDWKTRQGGGNRRMAAPLVIPHSDGAGDIDAVGAGVPPGRIGERVWIWNGQWQRPFGTAAEYIALPAQQAVPLPAGLDYDEGACLGIPAFTAMQAVRLAGAAPGQQVLVQGGAGSVGHYAIQMAKARGATVITTVSSPRKAEHARAAGADHVLDYRTEDVAARVQQLTGGTGVDTVVEVDLAANAGLYPQLLRPHGRVVVYGTSGLQATLPSVGLMQKSVALQFFMIYDISPSDRAACLRELVELLDAGRLRHTIALRLPLDQVVRAHEAVEQGAMLGNVVLQVA
ncbi:MAG: NADPH:quinone oxidoreductase [Ramlibacter sp.]|nr:NADPH:quinone oxidoreductase [Ramlibacter sp.]